MFWRITVLRPRPRGRVLIFECCQHIRTVQQSFSQNSTGQLNIFLPIRFPRSPSLTNQPFRKLQPPNYSISVQHRRGRGYPAPLTSPTSAGSTPVRARTALSTSARRTSGVVSLNEPWSREQAEEGGGGGDRRGKAAAEQTLQT